MWDVVHPFRQDAGVVAGDENGRRDREFLFDFFQRNRIARAFTGVGVDVFAVMVTGIGLDWVGIRLFTQALSKVTALA